MLKVFFVIVGLLFVLLGMAGLFARRQMWDVQVLLNNMRGVESRRSGTWDRSASITAVVVTLTGVGIIILALTVV